MVLQEENIRAELTATLRTGVHRYTYPQGSEARVWIDMDHSATKGDWGRYVIQAQVRQRDSVTVVGYRMITGWARLRRVYFAARFSSPITQITFDNQGKPTAGALVANGDNVKALLQFGKIGQLQANVALSAVSIENALENLAAEQGSFDEVREKAQKQWDAHLGVVEIEATDEVKEKFYTALYHTMIQPNTFSDVNGQYVGVDYAVHQLPQGETQYTTFSLWDTYRAAHPLYSLLVPARNAEMVRSMLHQYQEYGYLPIWQLYGQDNYCMIGNHAVPVVVDAVLKGAPGVDPQLAYEAVRASLTQSHLNSPFDVWEKYGYMPEDLQTQSVSITLELAYDDWCAAQLAKFVGADADYEKFMKRAQQYRNLFCQETGFFQPKNKEGEWILPFDPYKYGANGGNPFTEGNAWQYSWYVPHDVDDLIALQGGKKAFCKKLDQFFTDHTTTGEKNDNASGFVGLYAHGNEPSHHVAYLYALAGMPHRTEQLVDHIKRNLYNTTPSGYAGNDDCGEMSAWYVFSALGFYPVNPCGGEYVLGSPSVDHAVLHLAGGSQVEIRVHRPSPDAWAVKRVKWNGKAVNGAIITQQQLQQGGILEFWLSNSHSDVLVL